MEPLKSAMLGAMNSLEYLASSKPETRAVLTGFQRLDDLLTCLAPGDLVVVAGHTSVGKSAFALALARNLCLDPDSWVPVAYFGGATTGERVSLRLMSSESGVPVARLLVGKVEPMDWTKLSMACGRLAEAPLFVDFQVWPVVETVVNEVYRLRQSTKVRVVIVDDVQSVDTDGCVDSGRDVARRVATALKALAIDCSLTVVAVSQLPPRETVDEHPLRMRMGDLGQLGILGEVADVVLSLRENSADQSSESHRTLRLDVAKNRDGPTGAFSLRYRPDCGVLNDELASLGIPG
jgi:replicative DNA helicase